MLNKEALSTLDFTSRFCIWTLRFFQNQKITVTEPMHLTTTVTTLPEFLVTVSRAQINITAASKPRLQGTPRNLEVDHISHRVSIRAGGPCR